MPKRREHFIAARKAAGFTQASLAARLGVDRSTTVRWEAGETEPLPYQWPKLARLLNVSADELAGLLARAQGADTVARDIDTAVIVAAPNSLPDLTHLERLHQDLHEMLNGKSMSDASLDDWEQTVLRYGKATRDRPVALLLADLSTDLSELKQAMERCHSLSALRRLTRVAAQMSGLMLLTLVKLDARTPFRRWARTARIAAIEAGDPATYSWVLSQEAYGHYYSGDMDEAIFVAQQAQELAAVTPGVSGPLAAALEARAHAALGRHQETRAALTRAERMVENLDGESLAASAFGYNEAQLRFHEGNAYTHLHDSRSAFAAQERALELCAPGDYTDWALTRLDRASCLAQDGDIAGAASYATETMTGLTDQQRHGIITRRAYEIVGTVPSKHRTLPAVRELHELLMLRSGTNEGEQS